MTKSEFIQILSNQAQHCRNRNDVETAKIVEFIRDMAYDLDDEPEPTTTRMAVLSIPHYNS